MTVIWQEFSNVLSWQKCFYLDWNLTEVCSCGCTWQYFASGLYNDSPKTGEITHYPKRYWPNSTTHTCITRPQCYQGPFIASYMGCVLGEIMVFVLKKQRKSMAGMCLAKRQIICILRRETEMKQCILSIQSKWRNSQCLNFVYLHVSSDKLAPAVCSTAGLNDASLRHDQD